MTNTGNEVEKPSGQGPRSVPLRRAIVGVVVVGLVMVGAGIGIGAAVWAGSPSSTPVSATVTPSSALGGSSGGETPYYSPARRIPIRGIPRSTT